MQADDEEGLARETQGEVRVVRIVGDAGVGGVADAAILVGERLGAGPERALEGLLREVVRALEHHGEALEQVGPRLVAAQEGEERPVEARVVLAARDVARDRDAQAPAGEGGLGPDAGEGRVSDEIAKPLGQGMGRIVPGKGQRPLREAGMPGNLTRVGYLLHGHLSLSHGRVRATRLRQRPAVTAQSGPDTRKSNGRACAVDLVRRTGAVLNGSANGIPNGATYAYRIGSNTPMILTYVGPT